MDAAWSCGDPGLFFLDRVHVPFGVDRRQMTLVPCGEQSMSPYETCNLGALNLAQCVSPHREIQWSLLSTTAGLAARFLDQVINCTEFAVQQCQEATAKHRRVGLGVMGFADMLQALGGIPYGSRTAQRLATRLGKCITKSARAQLPAAASVTCVAPTGGITLLTDNQGWGIEPFFAESTTLRPQDHLAIQAAWQRGMENAISKTVNLPRHANKQEVADTFSRAWKLRCKGVTVYRDGSSSMQPISLERKPSARGGQCTKCD